MTSALPVLKVARLRRWLEAASVGVQSPFSLTEQVQDWGGRRWAFEVDMAPTEGDDARSLSVFFDALGGRAGKFVLLDASVIPPSGIGAPEVDGAGQSGATLETTGFTPSVTLPSGHLFSLGSGATRRLYRNTAPIEADSNGDATIAILPPLREAPGNGDALDFTAPSCVCRLVGAVPTDISLAGITRFSLQAREAL